MMNPELLSVFLGLPRLIVECLKPIGGKVLEVNNSRLLEVISVMSLGIILGSSF